MAIAIKRDDKGRFAKGSVPNPLGRMTRVTEKNYLRLFKQAMTQAAALAILERAVDDALNGDWRARRFLFDYVVGPPQQVSLTETRTTYDPATDTQVTRIAKIITQLSEEEARE